MAIQHVDIPDAQIHEPKGVVSALEGYTYVANGSGSGNWRRNAAYGSQVITNNAVNFALTAVADTTFNTTSQYTLLTGAGAPWTSDSLYGVSFSVDRLTAPVTGVYEVKLWMNVLTFPTATAKVAARYRINGTGAFSARKPTVKSGVAGDIAQLVFSEHVALTAADYIQLYVASDGTGNLVMGDANLTLTLVRQTA